MTDTTLHAILQLSLLVLVAFAGCTLCGCLPATQTA